MISPSHHGKEVAKTSASSAIMTMTLTRVTTERVVKVFTVFILFWWCGAVVGDEMGLGGRQGFPEGDGGAAAQDRV